MSQSEPDWDQAIVDIVQQVYAEEAQAARERIDRLCDGGLFELGMSWLPYVGDFLEPTCGAPNPVTDVHLAQRVRSAIARIEQGLGMPLDAQTQDNIRADVRGLWGRGPRPGE